MNKLKELSYNVEALNHAVNQNADIFSPITSFVKKLNHIVVEKSELVNKDEVFYLAQKIEDFIKQYRLTPDSGYIFHRKKYQVMIKL